MRKFVVILSFLLTVETLMADCSLREKIGQMILVGFHGTTIEEPEAKVTLQLAEKNLIGGIILFQYNIHSPDQVKRLLTPFQGKKLLIAIDQEGGRVQRLKSIHGFKETASAQDIGKGSIKDAETAYNEMAEQLNMLGFNLNFGPVVDLHDDKSAVIGRIQRSYSSEPKEVVQYANAFIKAHHKNGILTALKHFPGHGFALKDSHKGMVDVTQTYQDVELVPYKDLIQQKDVDIIMTAHIINRNIDPDHPATLSKKTLIPILREQLGFEGVVITDDLHMGAIGQHYTFEETVIRAINAGVDILLFSNNQQAAGGVKEFKPDASLAIKIITIIEEAIKAGLITEERINESYQRIRTLKEKLT